MKQLIDFIPLIAFFSAYKLYDIYVATQVLILVTTLQYAWQWIRQGRLENFQLITLIAVYVFGSLTLFMHDETFLKWKAPVVNWLFALIFLGSEFVGKHNLVQRMIGHAVKLPDPVWRTLNYSWVIFFIVCGAANLYVAFTYEAFWVDFKVFGSLAMTLFFLIGQSAYLSRHVIETSDDSNTPSTENK